MYIYTFFIERKYTLNWKLAECSKGPEWNPLLFAHPSTLNNRKPIGCADPTLGVFDGGTPYVAISKGFHSGPLGGTEQL